MLAKSDGSKTLLAEILDFCGGTSTETEKWPYKESSFGRKSIFFSVKNQSHTIFSDLKGILLGLDFPIPTRIIISFFNVYAFEVAFGFHYEPFWSITTAKMVSH